jgi:hypothetical protein
MSGRLIAVTLLAWGSVGVRPPNDTHLTAGIWGGEHVRLETTASDAHLEFDCGSGEISQPMTTTDDGRLDVEGVLVRGRPGPIRIGEEPKRLRARYAGTLTKNSLTFVVTLVDSNERAGPYTVVLGEAARLRKCR